MKDRWNGWNMKKYASLYAVIIMIVAGYNARAQDDTFSISGVVTDSTSGQPLDHASVYLSNTTVGSNTAEDGSFSLQNVPLGHYQLVVSYIGYQSEAIEVDENEGGMHFSVALHTAISRLKAVIVRGGVQNKSYLRIFTRYFIGTDENASFCKILNPDVLYFHLDSTLGIFTAEATEPLIIRNLALGYVIYYDLQSFKLDRKTNRITYFGYPKFEEIDKGGKHRQKKWQNKRITTYLGSIRHFMQSLTSHQLREQGFKMNKLTTIHDSYLNKDYSVLSPEKVPYDSMITPSEAKPGYVKLKFTNSLYIAPFDYRTPALNHFFRWKKDAPLSEMTVTEIVSDFITTTHHVFTPCILTMTVPETYIDPNGVLTNPLAVTLQGGWSQNRVSDLLPLNYKMPVLR